MIKLPGLDLQPEIERIVDEYCRDFNIRSAARRLGKTTEWLREKLREPDIAELVRDKKDELAESSEIDRAWLVQRLRMIADSNMREIAEWGFDMKRQLMPDGSILVQPGVYLHPSDVLTKANAYAVAEIGNTKDGVKIKLHDKRAAIMDLAKILGHVTDKSEVKATVEDKTLDVSKLTDAQLLHYLKFLESLEHGSPEVESPD